MTLLEYTRRLTPAGRREFAQRVGTCTNYISQLANSHRKPSVDMAKRIQRASNYEISMKALRPDIFE